MNKTPRSTGSKSAEVFDSSSAEHLLGSYFSQPDMDAIVGGVHTNPFSVLGHQTHSIKSTDSATSQCQTVACFRPQADDMFVVDKSGTKYPMSKIHDAGLFVAIDSELPSDYMLEFVSSGESRVEFDAYRFKALLGEMDHYLLNEGSHIELFDKLGSHVTTINGVQGVLFAVWAPNAATCAVIGDFNFWDDRRHVMRRHTSSGIWEIFVPEAVSGSKYKYALRDQNNKQLPYKNDPYARFFEAPPGNASYVFESDYKWMDEEWQQRSSDRLLLTKPVSIYEVHLPSWRLSPEGEAYTYRELAEHLIPYVVDNGFTHLELMPVTEHPFTGSWGYQPIGMFAPTQRLGDPDDFRFFVDMCHKAGLGVIMDWVPAHFPSDDHGLGNFDGTHLYEHADPRQGHHKDWDTLIYNFGRNEVRNYLLCNALFWIREFHLDGLRVDAVASMLYLDYSREDGEWIPNEHGGNHNLEAVSFLQKLNELVHHEGAITLAEESTSWEGVTRPVFANGLGFTYKWNMGWMHDTLEYMSEDPINRQHHHERLTFGQLYAFSENFVLPFSHDEVVYGKRSMLRKMPGDEWQSFANLRCLLGFMYAYPGKKLLFMGNEFGQAKEWSHDDQLQWPLLGEAPHASALALTRQLNELYRSYPAMYAGDCDSQGFQWMDCDDAELSVVAFYRRVPESPEFVIAVCNFTPVVREDYLLGVYDEGSYVEVLNTDDGQFGGSDVCHRQDLVSEPIPAQGKPHSLRLRLAPLATFFLTLKKS